MGINNPQNRLDNMTCIPCRGDVAPLAPEEICSFRDQLSPDWKIIDNHHLQRTFTFKNFRQALDFTNLIGEIADFMGHHPDIFLAWGKVKVEILTHKIDGLHQNDFILAKKIDAISH